MALPAWLAAMVQVPALMIVTVEPDTVQIVAVVDVKAIANPEVAVAETVNGALPNVLPASAVNEIVCAPFATANDCVTWVAAL